MGIPPWVVKLLEQAKADDWTGTIAIVYRKGEPRHAKREDVLFPPDEEPTKGRAVRPAPTCPQGCGPMEEKDYGNLFVCARCNTKRTRGQVNSARLADKAPG